MDTEEKLEDVICHLALPEYQLWDGETWPPGWSGNLTRLHLYLFGQGEGKGSEVPHGQDFFVLRDKPDSPEKEHKDSQILTMIVVQP